MPPIDLGINESTLNRNVSRRQCIILSRTASVAEASAVLSNSVFENLPSIAYGAAPRIALLHIASAAVPGSSVDLGPNNHRF